MRPSVLLLSTLSLASHVVAGDVDANDLPTQCQDVCAPVVSLTSTCDKKTSEDDHDETSCICKDSRAAKSIPMCAACLTKYGKDGSDNDANDLVRSCSLTTTSYSPTSSASASSGTASNTSASATSSGGAMSSSSMSGSMSSMGSASATTPASTSNAATGSMEPGNGIMGAVLVGLMAMV